MSKIPASIDELMWLLADQDSPEAIDAFIQRYPEHRREMTRRALAVKDLRHAKPNLEGRAIPTFQRPRPLPQKSFRPMSLAVGMGALALLFASYVVIRSFGQPNTANQEMSASAEMASPAEIARTRKQPAVKDESTFDRSHISKIPTPTMQGAPMDSTGEFAQPSVGSNTTNSAVPAKATDPRYTKPVTIKFGKARLTDAIQLVCAYAGLEAQIAPGMPEIEIEGEYSETPAMTILKEMGQVYGFTAFDQGNGQVLILPAVDSRVNP